MGKRPFNGHEIALDLTAGVAIPEYTIVAIDATDKTKVNLATAGSQPLAVAIPTDEEMMSDGNGGFVKRTGYQIGESPTLYDSGTLWVKLGGPVNFGDILVPMAGGLAAAETAPTFSASPTKAELDAAFAEPKTRLGKAYKAGQTGDIIPFKSLL
jgi:hypothetical protein